MRRSIYIQFAASRIFHNILRFMTTILNTPFLNAFCCVKQHFLAQISMYFLPRCPVNNISHWFKQKPLHETNYTSHIYRGLSAGMQYLQCVSNGVTAVLHWAIVMLYQTWGWPWAKEVHAAWNKRYCIFFFISISCVNFLLWNILRDSNCESGVSQGLPFTSHLHHERALNLKLAHW